MNLIIPKDYLLRLEGYTKFGYNHTYDPFACRYVFKLPKTAGLPDGYTVNIDAAGVEYERDKYGNAIHEQPLYTQELKGESYSIPFNRQNIYEAVMTENREPGKKYKRYKYTAEELYALYQNFDLTDAKYALAKVLIYKDGFTVYDRVIDNGYYIGKRKGCWFYCSDLDTKRRIGSKGVTIISEFSEEHLNEIKAALRERKDEIKAIRKNLNSISYYKSDLRTILRHTKDLYKEAQGGDLAILEPVVKAAEEATKYFTEKELSIDNALNCVDENFINKIKKIIK